MELRDPISSASHLATAAWAVFATLVLVRLTIRGTGRQAAAVVFGASMAFLYLASGVFHGVPFTRTGDPDLFRFFQRVDQSAIYVFIAGTNTPCLVALLAPAAARWFLGLVWGVAAVGVGSLWLLPKAPHWVMVMNFLLMGWLGVLPVAWYYRALGWKAMNWMWLGAGLYTCGAACELLEWPTISEWPLRFGYHEVLHLFDSAGSVVFFLFVARHVVTYQRPLPCPA